MQEIRKNNHAYALRFSLNSNIQSQKSKPSLACMSLCKFLNVKKAKKVKTELKTTTELGFLNVDFTLILKLCGYVCMKKGILRHELFTKHLY